MTKRLPFTPRRKPEDFQEKPHFNAYEKSVEDGYRMGRLLGIAIRRDVEALEAQYRATHDNLTGLLNREGFDEKVNQRIKAGHPFGLLYLDLTNFKIVNDTHPDRHEAGDRVLKTLASILKSTLRADDSESSQDYIAYQQTESGAAGRVGGDEFNVAVDLRKRPERNNGYTPEQRLAIVKGRVSEAFQEYVSRDPSLVALPLSVDVGIGASVWEPGMSADQLKQAADSDLKLHKAEQHGSLGQYRP